MIVGLPREVKDNEYRVGLVPAGVKELTNAGHKVIVQAAAGEGWLRPLGCVEAALVPELYGGARLLRCP